MIGVAQRTTPRFAASEIQAMVAAAIAQLGYNPTGTTNYPCGVVATSVELYKDDEMPLAPSDKFAFTPTYARVFLWNGSDGAPTKLVLVNDGDTLNTLQDFTHEQKLAHINFDTEGSFEVHDLLNDRRYRVTANLWPFPIAINFSEVDSQRIVSFQIGSKPYS